MTTTAPAPAGHSVLDTFGTLERALQDELVERDREIHGALVALLSGEHLFLLGPPGIAKSFLVDRLTARISGVRLFKILMRRLTMPDEIFGPLDVPALQHSHWTRAAEGYLPTADMAFLDEVFKASSAILNGLLDILNERTWRDDGQIKPVPLRTMFCASNEEPQEEGLVALYDRIMLRYVVRPVQEMSSFTRMLRLGNPGVPDPVITWGEIVDAQQAVAAVPIPVGIFDKIADLRSTLKKEGIEPTERRFVRSLRLLQAEAWLDGAEEVAMSHMSILAHVLWESPSQQADVEKVVLELANPLERKANALLADIEDIHSLLATALKENLTQADSHAKGMEIYHKTKRAHAALADIQGESGGGRQMAQIIERCRDRLEAIVHPLVTKVFQMPESATSQFMSKPSGSGK